MVLLKEVRQLKRDSGIRGTLASLLKPVVFMITHKRITSVGHKLGKSKQEQHECTFYHLFLFSLEMTSRIYLST